ncbi:MAG: hypothetical protein JWN32_2514, partial [Solirubrobacterales bacterium]|nr:hypothetical protein [Solirubrobacterales bacterium]
MRGPGPPRLARAVAEARSPNHVLDAAMRLAPQARPPEPRPAPSAARPPVPVPVPVPAPPAAASAAAAAPAEPSGGGSLQSQEIVIGPTDGGPPLAGFDSAFAWLQRMEAKGREEDKAAAQEAREREAAKAAMAEAARVARVVEGPATRSPDAKPPEGGRRAPKPSELPDGPTEVRREPIGPSAGADAAPGAPS